MADYTGPERRIGPPSRRTGEGGRYSDRRKLPRDVRHVPERRRNDGRRVSLGDYEAGDYTGLRRIADREAYEAWVRTEAS